MYHRQRTRALLPHRAAHRRRRFGCSVVDPFLFGGRAPGVRVKTSYRRIKFLPSRIDGTTSSTTDKWVHASRAALPTSPPPQTPDPTCPTPQAPASPTPSPPSPGTGPPYHAAPTQSSTTPPSAYSRSLPEPSPGSSAAHASHREFE